MDLSIADIDAVTWAEGGLSVDSQTVISSPGPASKLFGAVEGTNELTVEAWVTPAAGEQSGPARIVASSLDPYARNFLLGQGAWGSLPDDVFAARVRSNSSTGGTPTLFTPAGSLSGSLTHLVLTRNAAGVRTLFVDGVARSTDTDGGMLANWDAGFPLLLANTADGSRPWRGIYCRVAIFDQALSATEVIGRHAGGCAASPNIDPVIDPVADQTSDEGDTVSTGVTATDDDGDQLAYAATGLPAGLGIDAITGEISGEIAQTAAANSPYVVEVAVDDRRGGVARTEFGWVINQVNLYPTINPIADRVDNEGQTILLIVDATDEDQDALLFSANGLPDGLVIDPATGEISGTIADGAAATSPYAAEVTVDDQAAGIATSGFEWSVAAGPSRVSEGLVALYEFSEGSGTVVGDSSGRGDPIDLLIADAGAVSWTEGGLSVDSQTVISSAGPASKLFGAVAGTNELTVEAWVTPAAGEQSGPARIVASSLDPYARNFLLGQGAWGSLPDDVFAGRVRSGSSAGGTPTLFTPAGSLSGGSTHVVLTRDAAGVRTLYVDGVARSTDTVDGALANWDPGFPLLLANTADGGRPWLGEFQLVSIYERALDASEVLQNYDAGPEGDAEPPNAPPIAVATATPVSGSAPLDVSFDGSGSSDPDDSIVSYEWDFGDGDSGAGASVAHRFVDPGVYTVGLTVTDEQGDNATDTLTVTVDQAPFGPTIVSQPVDATVVDGQTAVFVVVAEGDPAPTYQWYRDSVPIVGATDVTVDLSGVTLADNGTELFVEVSGHGPTLTSDTVILAVVEPGVVSWWSASHPYRLPVSVSADGVARQGKVALVDLDFAPILAGGTFDPDSLRLVEYDAVGGIVDPAVPFQFDPGPGYDATTTPVGTLAVVLTGATPGSGERNYHLYLDVVGGGNYLAPPVAALVGPAESTVDEGQSSYRIATEIGDWYYHKEGGGFSSLDDVDGNDWIGYQQGGGSAGEYRGIPNLVYPEGHFHPGAASSTTTLQIDGPVRATLESTTEDGWAVRWDLFPTYATATVLAAPSAYWFLYEGTPGGQVEEVTDTVTRSGGITTPLSEQWSGDLPDAEWAYFTDVGLDRSLFVVSHEGDDAVDSYRTMNGVMTVFGLGRDGLGSGLTGYPRSFSVGLVDGNGAETALRSANAPLLVTVGAAEPRPVSQTDPTAIIRVDTTAGETPLDVSFDGSGSTDPDGLIVDHQWDFGDGATASGAVVDHQYTTSGRYQATLTVVDDAGNIGVDHVGVVVSTDIPDTPPEAVDDAYGVDEDAMLAVSAGTGLLANDVDSSPPDDLTTLLVSNPSNGTLVSFVADGSFTYEPAPDFNGSDSFSYEAVDGAGVGTAQATVTITVNAVNDVPVATDDGVAIFPDTSSSLDVDALLLANDSDADGDPLALGSFTQPTSGTLLNNGDGTLTYTPDTGFVGIDGFTYTASDGVSESNSANVTVSVDAVNTAPIFVTGTPSFTKQIIDNTVDETHAVVAADFTGDGEIDLAATDFVDGMILWYENDGNGGFINRVLDSNLPGAYPASVGDVDGDGDADVMAAGYDADTFAWYESDGAGGFTRHDIDTASDGAHSIVTADMDGDGDGDFLTSSQDANTIAWYENDGALNFTLRVIDTNSDGAKRAEYADLDGDGDMDVVTASFFDDTIAWYVNNGSESFTKQIIDSTADGAYFVTPADIDGDGDVDIFSASQRDNTVAWYRNDGVSGFSAQTLTAGANAVRRVAAVDIDGDGDVDALSANKEDDTIALYLNDGSGSFSARIVDSDAPGAYGLFVIDINDDDQLDILSASRDSGEIAIHRQSTTHFLAIGLGDSVTIDSTLLLTTDPDDGPSELTYTVTAQPDFGVLALSGLSLGIGSSFSQEDVDLGRLTYTHDGVDQSDDGFEFSVADGGEGGVQPLTGRFVISVAGFSGSLVELPLDEGSGVVAGDVSGNGFDGELVNGASFEANSADGSPYSVRFDGLDDIIDLGAIDPTGTGLTLAAWVKADSFPGSSNDPRIISKATGLAANDHIFMLGTISASGDVRLRARVRHNGTTQTLIAPTGNLSIGAWHHTALVADGSTIRLFLDGVEVGNALSFGAVDSVPAVSVAVGAQPLGAGGRFFDGLIDDVRILSRAMSAAEISAIAAGGN